MKRRKQLADISIRRSHQLSLEQVQATIEKLAQREGVEMPISQAVYALLFQGADPREVVFQLMGRKLKHELE